MVTIQEYLNNKYPTKEEKEQVKEIIIGYSTKKEARRLDEGELNLSEYPNLKRVEIDGYYLKIKSKLTSLDLSNCSQLTSLNVHSNRLSHLDLSNCPNLKELDCSNNSLSKLGLHPQAKLASWISLKITSLNHIKTF